MDKTDVPNKDFVFSYTTEDYQLPSSVYGFTDKGATVLLSFIPKFCQQGLGDAYKNSIEGKTFETNIDNASGEYIFLLDRSGSMGGARMQKARDALVLFIRSLPQISYFNVVSFGSESERMFEQSVKNNDKNIKNAVSKIEGMSADLGGT
jgi:hypothetical protein